jgi:hypothetical protein
VQFVVNALFGIGIGWLFVTLAKRGGASVDEQALAYFLPGILYNSGYAVVMAATCLIGWPLVGFMVGSVTGEPTAWHDDKQIVKLCTRLTWLLVLPCVLRAVIQGPIWLAGNSGAIDPHTAVALLGVQDRPRLAAPDRGPRRDGLAARPQPHAGPGQRLRNIGAGGQPPCREGASRRSRSFSTSALTTNSSSSCASTGCSALGV